MTLRRGTVLTTMLTLVAAAGAVAFAGYTTFGGRSLCSLMACDSAKTCATTTQVAVGAQSHDCPFHEQIQASHTSGCPADCASKMACAAGCSHGQASAFVTFNASFPLAVPAAFNDSERVCPSTLVKASGAACTKTASACCSKSKAAKAAQTLAVAHEGCSESKAAQAQTLAAAHEGCSTAHPCDPAGCAAKDCVAKGCAPGQCDHPCTAFVTVPASFPVAIPAAFNDQKQVCPSTLVKAASCSDKVSDAAAAGCPYAAAQMQTVAASNETNCPNAKHCDKSSCDPSKCAAKGCDPSNCPKAQAAGTEASAAETEKSEG